MKSTTIRDIAKKLNISVSTVSRALSDHPAIKDTTKEAVIKAAKELNYSPNVVAQNFRRNKTNILGIVVPDIVTHFFSATISGIQNEATARGYNIMICQSNENFETEVQNINTLVSSQIDGLLISLSKETTNFEHVKALHEKEMPIVFFDRIYDGIDVSKVTVDDYEGAYKATEHLIAMGYKNIAHISGPRELSISQNRLRGYIDALGDNFRAVRDDMIQHSSLSREDIRKKTHLLLDLPNPPDAILAIHDPVAVQVMMVLKEKKIRIPQEFGIVGFNNEPVSEVIEPSLTTIEQPAYQIGLLAARHLINQIDHPETFNPQKEILKTKLIVRNSSRKAGYEVLNS